MRRLLMALLFLMLVAPGAGAPVDAVAENPLCAPVRAALEGLAGSQPGLQASVRCRPSLPHALPAGASVQVRGLASGAALYSGSQTVQLQVKPLHGPGFSVALPVVVSWRSPAWVLGRDLPAGERLRPQDLRFEELTWPDGGLVEVARLEEPPSGRLRRAMRQDQVLRSAELMAADALQRGDRVTAVLASPGLEISLPAQLMAPARVGQRVRVQATGRNEALEGRLVDLTTVRLDSE